MLEQMVSFLDELNKIGAVPIALPSNKGDSGIAPIDIKPRKIGGHQNYAKATTLSPTPATGITDSQRVIQPPPVRA